MSALSIAELPETLRSVRTRPLFVMKLAVRPLVQVGATPGVNRRIGIVFGGSFEGERLAGEVMDGGSDWLSVRSDGATELDVRLSLKTNDGAIVAVTYRGLRHGPADVIQRMERGEPVDPADYYFRTMVRFETAAPQYDWLNRILAIGVGLRRLDGPVYSLFELL